MANNNRPASKFTEYAILAARPNRRWLHNPVSAETRRPPVCMWLALCEVLRIWANSHVKSSNSRVGKDSV